MVEILVTTFDTAVESENQFTCVDVFLFPASGGNLFLEIYAFGSQLVFHSQITAQYVRFQIFQHVLMAIKTGLKIKYLYIS